ncbi:hypothetical protein CR513_43226, partial [Mucuna pruriens]
MATTSLAEMAIISAQETVRGQANSSFALASSITERSYPYETVMEEHSQDTSWDFRIMLSSIENVDERSARFCTNNFAGRFFLSNARVIRKEIERNIVWTKKKDE